MTGADRNRDWDSRVGTYYVRISLTTSSRGSEQVPHRSGLNWGQREGRNLNQAYLPVPASEQRSGFFPEIGELFLVECDDGVLLQLVRAQQNGKALQTPDNNALLGEYFRRRLGVRTGDPVALRHLHQYGRTSVDIFKTSDGTYFLDFRPLEI
jgi:hypothetical protein